MFADHRCLVCFLTSSRWIKWISIASFQEEYCVDPAILLITRNAFYGIFMQGISCVDLFIRKLYKNNTTHRWQKEVLFGGGVTINNCKQIFKGHSWRSVVLLLSEQRNGGNFAL